MDATPCRDPTCSGSVTQHRRLASLEYILEEIRRCADDVFRLENRYGHV
jgi:hypothetical protein